MGKCLRSCTKQRRQPAPPPEAAAYLTLRSGRRVPVAAAACSPRISRRHRRGSAGSGRRPCAKSARSSPRSKSCRSSQVGNGRPEELPSQPNYVPSCGDSRDTHTPMSGKVSKHDHEAKGVAGRPSPSPLEAEIEAFFAAAELTERRRFAKTYNYDIALDRPLDGRFEWTPVST